MVVRDEIIIEASDSGSKEEVIQTWKRLMTDEWVEEILIKPDTEQHVYSLAAKLDLSLPDAWSTYFAGMVASQM